MAKTLEEHYGYLSDRAKLERYRSALDKAVNAERSVLDLGCGSGLLGLMALQAGARKVVFVEEEPVIEVARRTVAEAGFAGRAEFYNANSYELSLPERVDLVVCDHVGYFGFDYGVLALLADAKQRFLKPGGIIVPVAIDLLLAPVESDSCRNLVSRWRDGSVPEDYDWLGNAAANTKHAVEITQNELLAEAKTLVSLELGAQADPYLSWSTEFQCARGGTLDGVAGWFDCTLADDINMTNAPRATERLNRPQAFLPLEAPVSVHESEGIRVTVMARHLDNVIGWDIELPDSGRRFSQSTFQGLLLDREVLTRANPDRVATLNNRGRARQIVLSYCDGKRTVAEVQALVDRDHPALFPSEQAAASFVTRVLAWDTGK
jgi:protein arginine N-methyltransferase 1